MKYTREQAELFLAQGSLCRAAVAQQSVVSAEPTTENIHLLADIYAQQGLTEDALALYAKTIICKSAATTSYVN